MSIRVFRMNRGTLILILLFLWIKPVTARAPQSVDLHRMKSDIQIFEAIMDEALSQVFSNPFAVIERVKGVYLNGYGPTFTFLVNIKAATLETPFGTIRRSDAANPKLREDKTEELKQKVVNILGGYANSLGQLKTADSVTVVAHIKDQNFNTKSENKTIIIKALKKDLIDNASRQISVSEFKKRVNIVEY